MSDLRERFRALDQIPSPDLREDILRRPVRRHLEPRWGRRLAAAAVAAGITALAVALLVRAFLGQPPPRPAEDPEFTIPTPSRVEEILHVEPVPHGERSSLMPGWVLARIEHDLRVTTMSVRRSKGGGICFHLNSGRGCGSLPSAPGEPLVVHVSGNYDPDPTTFVYGAVMPSIREVRVEFTDGTRISAAPIPGPAELTANFYLFGVRGSPVLGSVRVVNADGRAFTSPFGTVGALPIAAGILDVPAQGGTATGRLADGRPVFVVHHDDGTVTVVDGISTHVTSAATLVGWCESSGWFEEPHYGSKFDPHGVYRDGPAPTGLITYEIVEAGPSQVRVVGAHAPASRWTPGEEPTGPFCMVVGRPPKPLVLPPVEPVDATLSEVVASHEGWVGVRAILEASPNGALLCEPDTDGVCRESFHVPSDTKSDVGTTYRGVWLIEVRNGAIVSVAATPDTDFGSPRRGSSS